MTQAELRALIYKHYKSQAAFARALHVGKYAVRNWLAPEDATHHRAIPGYVVAHFEILERLEERKGQGE